MISAKSLWSAVRRSMTRRPRRRQPLGLFRQSGWIHEASASTDGFPLESVESLENRALLTVTVFDLGSTVIVEDTQGETGAASNDNVTYNVVGGSFIVTNNGVEVLNRSADGVNAIISTFSNSADTMDSLVVLGLPSTASLVVVNAGDNPFLYMGSGVQTGVIVNGGAADDTIIGGFGSDTLSGGGGADFVHGRQRADQLSGGDGDDTLRGGYGDDTLDGGDGVDALFGMGNNDLVLGGAGNDRGNGGVGNDTINGGAGSDRIRGGSGNADVSLVVLSDATPSATVSGFTVTVGGDTDSALSSTEILEIDARAVTGTATVNASGASGGIDTIHIFGGIGNDNLTGGSNSDNVITGGAGNDTLTGGNRGDELFGDAGDDSLLGLGGDDTLTGGDGTDTADGGAGIDAAFTVEFVSNIP